MKVTNTSITDKELAEVLSQAGMPDKQIKAFLTECCGKECCPEKVRILRSARRTLLDSIHREQALLDRLDYVIWCAVSNTLTTIIWVMFGRLVLQ